MNSESEFEEPRPQSTLVNDLSRISPGINLKKKTFFLILFFKINQNLQLAKLILFFSKHLILKKNTGVTGVTRGKTFFKLSQSRSPPQLERRSLLM